MKLGTVLAVIGIIVNVIVLAALGIILNVRNYRECRAAGFSRLYCATTHLVN